MSVDFSSGVSEESYSIVIPLKTGNDIWSFTNPFHYEVWIFSLISVPIFILTLGLAEYITSGTITWKKWIGFVVRNIGMTGLLIVSTECLMSPKGMLQFVIFTAQICISQMNIVLYFSLSMIYI